MSDVRIAWFEIDERSKLEDFYANVWRPLPYEKDKRWLDWHILSNPNMNGKPFPLLLAWIGDEIVGHMVFVPTILWQRGEAHQVSWCNNLYVVPEHRRKKIAASLYAKSLGIYPAILGSGQSPANHQLMLKYEWKHVSKVNQLEKLFPSLPYIARSFREGPQKAVKRSAAMLYGMFKRGDTRDYSLRESDGVSDEWDRCWDQCKTRYSNIAQRDVRTINWRLGSHPYHDHVVIEARDSNGTLRGFIGGRVSGNAGRIVDFLVDAGDSEAADVLVAGLERKLRDRGAIRIASRSVCVTLEAALRRAGYLPTSFEQHFFIKSDHDYSLDPNDWHVTAMDSDLDR